MTSQVKIDWQAKLLEVIPLLIGITITRQFNLQGWRALLVYALAAGTTRQLIELLESEVKHRQPLTEFVTTTAEGNDQPLRLTPQSSPPSESGETHQLVHATPGRLRVRVPLADNTHYAQHLQQQLNQDDRLRMVRVNPHAASVTVKYDIQQFTEKEIQACLSELITLALETFSEKLL